MVEGAPKTEASLKDVPLDRKRPNLSGHGSTFLHMEVQTIGCLPLRT